MDGDVTDPPGGRAYQATSSIVTSTSPIRHGWPREVCPVVARSKELLSPVTGVELSRRRPYTVVVPGASGGARAKEACEPAERNLMQD